jgi:hypothetical protein
MKMPTLEERSRMIADVLRASAVYPEGGFEGRGIVLCGGGEIYFACAWVCISMLRRSGCKLPIELWYRGPREMTSTMLAWMEELDVRCVDAYAVARQYPVRRLDSWEVKPYAIVRSRFEEVLYLDCDNMALCDPSFLFESEGYKRYGAVFWPDRYSGPYTGHEWLRREAWELCGVPYRLEAEIEAGQMVVDKRRCWQALALTLHLNEHSDFYYAYFLGDKDTFHLAWRRVGTEYYEIPYRPATLGDSQAMVQFDDEGKALFQHRNGAKWRVFGDNPSVPGFACEAECMEMLDQLRIRWDGVVHRFPDAFTVEERRWYEALCKVRWFEYQIEGQAPRLLELLPDFRIGHGWAEMEVAWMLEADKDGLPLLSLKNANAPTCFLRPAEEAEVDHTTRWQGRWLVYDRGEVELLHAEHAQPAKRSL